MGQCTYSVLFAAALILSQACAAIAGKVILNIKVVNSSDLPQTKEVIQPLPRGLSSNDIISLDGMELRYDPARTGYVVRTEQELGPKQSKAFEVEVRDVWIIREDEIADLLKHAKRLGKMLDGSIHSARAALLMASVTNSLENIAFSQAENEAARVGAEKHIEAFARDSSMFNSVRVLIAEMEDITAGLGMDPGRMTFFKKTGEALPGPALETGKVSFKVVVMNMSTSETRTVSVKQYLPAAVATGDVLETDGLRVQPDIERGACFLSKEGVELKPGETRTFNVVVRDRWNVNGTRIRQMKLRLITAWEKAKSQGNFKAVEAQIAGIVDLMKTVEQTRAPDALDQFYIEYYTAQGKDLDAIDEYIARVERLVPGAPPPPARYAWLSIYGIAVFLAVFGVAAYVRVAQKK